MKGALGSKKMDKNQKKFGIYVFLSTFSRNLIEVFIPVILYKFGFNLTEIILYYFLVNFISLLLSYPYVIISKRSNYKVLSIIGIISFILLQIKLNFLENSIGYLIGIAFLYASYRRGYWIARRFYNLNVIKKEKIATTYSILSIINQIGVIVSGYFGAVLLDLVSLKVVTVIAIILFFISIIPLWKIDCEKIKENNRIEFKKYFKQIPKSNLYLFGTYELLNIIKFLFPLYIFIYVKDTYQTIGIVNLISNLAIILFTYAYGKKLDASKKNFLKLAIVLTVIIYVFKANLASCGLFIVAFLEGVFTKMYELSINKEFLVMSKKFEYSNYNLIYEVTQNLFRSILTLIILIVPGLNLKNMIYITLGFMFTGVFFKFKYIGNNECNKRREDKNN